jgi:HEAT repeat protein
MGCDSGQNVPILIAVLKGDKSAYVRGCAALALGRLGAVASVALPSLWESADKDPSPVVRRRAYEAIQRIESG